MRCGDPLACGDNIGDRAAADRDFGGEEEPELPAAAAAAAAADDVGLAAATKAEK